MADAYDDHGYSGANSSDFKRKSIQDNDKNDDYKHEDDDNDENNTGVGSAKNNEYIRELLAEKISLDAQVNPHAVRLLDQEVIKAQQIGKPPIKEYKYVDIYREKPIKVTVKVLVPVREHPRFNFVGKLLGPKGNSMKRLQDETMCKMAILGRGSMKDRTKEEELRNSLDPKYAHLSDDLHVEISALGPPAEAHARVAFALAEVRKYLIPDNNDNIRQEQMREMEIISTIEPGEEKRIGIKRPMPPMSGEHPKFPRGVPMRSAGPVPGAGRGGAPVVVAPGPGGSRGVMPAKTKILSILDRARVAMEESYTGVYEEPPYEAVVPRHHERAAYVEYVPPPPTAHAYTSRHYDDYEYDAYATSSRHHSELADPYESYSEYSGKGLKDMQQQASNTSTSTTSSKSKFSRRKKSDASKKMIDITRDKPIRVAIRVVVPVRDHPKFNFVGKLLGPKGNSLKRLQEETMCKMAVLGRGSMRDKNKEEELRVSGDPKFKHLAEDLHVEITAFATPAEAHARIAYALAEVRRFLVPDYNDDIRQEQLWEMQALSTQTSDHTHDETNQAYGSNTDLAQHVTDHASTTSTSSTSSSFKLQSSHEAIQNFINQHHDDDEHARAHDNIAYEQPYMAHAQQNHAQAQYMHVAPTHANQHASPPVVSHAHVTHNTHVTHHNEKASKHYVIQQVATHPVVSYTQHQFSPPHATTTNGFAASTNGYAPSTNNYATNGFTGSNGYANVSPTSVTKKIKKQKGGGGGGATYHVMNDAMHATHAKDCPAGSCASSSSSCASNHANHATLQCSATHVTATAAKTHVNTSPLTNGLNEVSLMNGTTNEDDAYDEYLDEVKSLSDSPGAAVVPSISTAGILTSIPINLNQNILGRKRPLLVGASARSAMTPTKRTVMSLLARARAAQAKHTPASFQRVANEHVPVVPFLTDDYLPNTVNIL